MVGQSSCYADDERAEVLPFVPRDAASFLDVGCAAGGFGRGLRRAVGAATIVGVEVVESSARRAEESGYDEVVRGSFPEALAGSGRTFGCIVFNDVLEHMVDPWTALRATGALLAEGGTVVASIPNVRYFPVLLDLVRRDRWDYTDWGVLDRTHVRFFTRSTMCEMFRDCGFTVDTVAGINSGLELARYRRFKRLVGSRLGSAEWMQFVVVAHQS